MAKFDEAYFTSIPWQTNVYGLTKIVDDTDITKVLLGSSNGRVTCVEFTSKWDNPVSRDLPLTHIPTGEAEIISIDAFTRTSSNCHGLVVGISLVLNKSSHSTQKQFLNIYSSVEKGSENCLESIAEGCQCIELDFVPFQLCHSKIRKQDREETVFLLSGSNHEIHMYCQAEDGELCTFEKQPIEQFFPELQQLPSNVLWLDIKPTQDNKRLTAIGCDNGYVELSIVETSNEPNVLQKWTLQHDSLITSVRIFNSSTQHKCDSSLKPINSEDCHLLVCCAIEPCTLYLDVWTNGLERPVILPDSDNFDCVICSCVADVDWDGDNELLLGTFGQELLAYKMTTTQEGATDINMIWQRRFNSPIFAIDYLDMTGDGLCEIAVACLSGLHILQHQLDDAANVCAARIQHDGPQFDQEENTSNSSHST